MADERIEIDKHVVTETEEGVSESHSHKVVERDEGVKRPEVTTIVKETTIEETEE